MPPFIYIGLAAGLACAALFASATAGGMGGRLLLFFMAPLPAFLAGLGWGPIAAVISAVSATIGIALLLNLKAGLVVLVSHGLPAAYLCYLAQLSRPGPNTASPSSMFGGDAPNAAGLEWYPIGRIVAVAASIAGALALVTMFQISTDIDELRALLRDLIDKVFLKQLPGFKDRKVEDAELNLLAEIALYAFPAAAALSWLGGFLLNLYLAGRITLASGRLPRPWPDIAAMTYPRGFALLLAVSLTVVSLMTGYSALIASGFAGAFFVAYVFLGLAILHDITRGSTARPFILMGIYGTLVILNTWAALAVALVGVLEPAFARRRSAARTQGPPPRPPSPPPSS